MKKLAMLRLMASDSCVCICVTQVELNRLKKREDIKLETGRRQGSEDLGLGDTRLLYIIYMCKVLK